MTSTRFGSFAPQLPEISMEANTWLGEVFNQTSGAKKTKKVYTIFGLDRETTQNDVDQ